MIRSEGLAIYEGIPGESTKLILQVHSGISDLYRSLIPKYFRVQRQKYEPHITVSRNEDIPIKEFWGKYHNQYIEFWYDNSIQYNDTYYWLNVHSPKLSSIRLELGLPLWAELCRPPDGSDNFHCTIGNTKHEIHSKTQGSKHKT